MTNPEDQKIPLLATDSKIDNATIDYEENQPEEKLDAQALQNKMELLKNAVILLTQQEKTEDINLRLQIQDLLSLYKSGDISAEDYSALCNKAGTAKDYLSEQIVKKRSEYRRARINYLSQITSPDIKRKQVLNFISKNKLNNLQGKNIQAGGSNASGVYEIDNTNLVLIKKTEGTFEFEGSLPYLMQACDTDRIPRVLAVLKDNNITYKIMEKASGIQLDKLSAEQIAEVPQEHFDQFVDDLINLEQNGMQIDPSKKSNFFYDQHKGFVIIDISDAHYDPIYDGEINNIDPRHLEAIFLSGKKNEIIAAKIRKALERRFTQSV